MHAFGRLATRFIHARSKRYMLFAALGQRVYRCTESTLPTRISTFRHRLAGGGHTGSLHQHSAAHDFYDLTRWRVPHILSRATRRMKAPG